MGDIMVSNLKGGVVWRGCGDLDFRAYFMAGFCGGAISVCVKSRGPGMYLVLLSR